jgi:hypothetical protein
MSKYEENWWAHFVPECYFDTVLTKTLLQTKKRLLHLHGCNNVINELVSKRLKDDFAVAIIDRDKREPDYFKKCKVLFDDLKLILWKHENKMQFIIQLNPPLEKWVVEILDENGLAVGNFGYPADYKKLKKQIKNDIDTESDERLNQLINAIIKTDCATIKKLKSILHYLKEKNYESEINELINV